ncbi:MAG: methylglyoxal synthase [Clostridia bacterium]|nr:methylglyoxal synthase [Clostridia bacterium]
MNIALIAHDKKKDLMVDFCIAYKSILQMHNLFATGTTGAIISKATGLNIYKFSPGPLGGEQQIAARVAYNEIDLVIYFRHSLNAMGQDNDASSLLRSCDANNIPFATNIATAELLIKGVERGDLAWRELINPNIK